MFPVEHASDFSYVQLWLLHWLQVYDWAFSLSENEKPSEEVLENDEKFDYWYEKYVAQKMRESRQSESSGRQTKAASSHTNRIDF